MSSYALYIRQTSAPIDNAYLAVQYRDMWFYIQDNDVASKETFMLFETLLALQAGEIRHSQAPLTLPVR